MPKKTNLPQRIVAFLKRNPTASRREISQSLGVGYQAIQKHLRRLEEEGLVKPGFLVSPEWDADRHEFWIFIATRFDRSIVTADAGSPDYQRALCQKITEELVGEGEYAEVISFDSIQILLGGDWDLVLKVYAPKADAVGRFVTRYLRSQKSIVRTSTTWALTD